MKQGFFLLFLLCNFSVFSQEKAKTTAEQVFPLYKVKLTLLDQSYFSLPTIKVHNEFLILKNNNPLYTSVDLGYNFNSQDELTKARGYYFGWRLNQYRPKFYKAQNCISYGFFYQRSVLNDFLKVSKSLPGFGEYSEYEKMKYWKERYGFSIDFLQQYALIDNLFLEIGFSAGIMYMNTITPDAVTQLTFVNGVYREKEVVTPSIGFSMKLGYSLF